MNLFSRHFQSTFEAYGTLLFCVYVLKVHRLTGILKFHVVDGLLQLHLDFIIPIFGPFSVRNSVFFVY